MNLLMEEQFQTLLEIQRLQTGVAEELSGREVTLSVVCSYLQGGI